MLVWQLATRGPAALEIADPRGRGDVGGGICVSLRAAARLKAASRVALKSVWPDRHKVRGQGCQR
jgi:hypothetical protein